jgi:hypothetical protein
MSNAIDALFYLKVMSLKNAVVSRVQRLKQPKYLIGAIVGVAYVYSVFFRQRGNRPGAGAALADGFPVEQLPLVASLGALAFMIFVAGYWLWPRDRAALSFSEAEIAMLFPAPIRRKTLIHYRWINTQLRILFTALILTWVSSGWNFIPGDVWIRLVGWWLLLSTLDLHGVGSSFTITRLLDRGVTSVRRRVLTFIGAAVVVGAACLWTWRSSRVPIPADFPASAAAVFDYVGALLASGALSWLLLPARWVVAPLLAVDSRSFLLALGPALLLYAAHYVWVLRSEVAFEEASIAKAQKRAARLSAMREGKWRFGKAEPKARGAPFALSKVKRPELAFVWKNLLSSAGYLRPRTALIAAAIIVLGSSVAASADFDVLRNVVAVMALACAGYTLAFGPFIARQDLRHDLPNADILKTYPLRGWQIVIGEWLTPVAIVTVLLWLLLLVAALNFNANDAPPWLNTGVRAGAAVGAALLAPLLTALIVLLLNAAAVLFPAWVQMGGRVGGIDVFGQRIVFVGALFLVLAIALLPAVIAGGVVLLVVQWLVGFPLAIATGVIVVLAILGTEIALGTRWLGNRFERFDLSAELKP